VSYAKAALVKKSIKEPTQGSEIPGWALKDERLKHEAGAMGKRIEEILKASCHKESFLNRMAKKLAQYLREVPHRKSELTPFKRLEKEGWGDEGKENPGSRR